MATPRQSDTLFGFANFLVATSSPSFSRSLVPMLKRQGANSLNVKTTKDAIRAATKKQYDLVFFEHDERKLDALEFLSALKEANIDTPVIILTQEINPALRGMIEARGAKAFFQWPLDLNRLQLRASEILSKHFKESAAQNTPKAEPKKTEPPEPAKEDTQTQENKKFVEPKPEIETWTPPKPDTQTQPKTQTKQDQPPTKKSGVFTKLAALLKPGEKLPTQTDTPNKDKNTPKPAPVHLDDKQRAKEQAHTPRRPKPVPGKKAPDLTQAKQIPAAPPQTPKPTPIPVQKVPKPIAPPQQKDRPTVAPPTKTNRKPEPSKAAPPPPPKQAIKQVSLPEKGELKPAPQRKPEPPKSQVPQPQTIPAPQADKPSATPKETNVSQTKPPESPKTPTPKAQAPEPPKPPKSDKPEIAKISEPPSSVPPISKKPAPPKQAQTTPQPKPAETPKAQNSSSGKIDTTTKLPPKANISAPPPPPTKTTPLSSPPKAKDITPPPPPPRAEGIKAPPKADTHTPQAATAKPAPEQTKTQKATSQHKKPAPPTAAQIKAASQKAAQSKQRKQTPKTTSSTSDDNAHVKKPAQPKLETPRPKPTAQSEPKPTAQPVSQEQPKPVSIDTPKASAAPAQPKPQESDASTKQPTPPKADIPTPPAPPPAKKVAKAAKKIFAPKPALKASETTHTKQPEQTQKPTLSAPPKADIQPPEPPPVKQEPVKQPVAPQADASPPVKLPDEATLKQSTPEWELELDLQGYLPPALATTLSPKSIANLSYHAESSVDQLTQKTDKTKSTPISSEPEPELTLYSESTKISLSQAWKDPQAIERSIDLLLHSEGAQKTTPAPKAHKQQLPTPLTPASRETPPPTKSTKETPAAGSPKFPTTLHKDTSSKLKADSLKPFKTNAGQSIAHLHAAPSQTPLASNRELPPAHSSHQSNPLREAAQPQQPQPAQLAQDTQRPAHAPASLREKTLNLKSKLPKTPTAHTTAATADIPLHHEHNSKQAISLALSPAHSQPAELSLHLEAGKHHKSTLKQQTVSNTTENIALHHEDNSKHIIPAALTPGESLPPELSLHHETGKYHLTPLAPSPAQSPAAELYLHHEYTPITSDAGKHLTRSTAPNTAETLTAHNETIHPSAPYAATLPPAAKQTSTPKAQTHISKPVYSGTTHTPAARPATLGSQKTPSHYTTRTTDTLNPTPHHQQLRNLTTENTSTSIAQLQQLSPQPKRPPIKHVHSTTIPLSDDTKLQDYRYTGPATHPELLEPQIAPTPPPVKVISAEELRKLAETPRPAEPTTKAPEPEEPPQPRPKPSPLRRPTISERKQPTQSSSAAHTTRKSTLPTSSPEQTSIAPPQPPTHTSIETPKQTPEKQRSTDKPSITKRTSRDSEPNTAPSEATRQQTQAPSDAPESIPQPHPAQALHYKEQERKQVAQSLLGHLVNPGRKQRNLMRSARRKAPVFKPDITGQSAEEDSLVKLPLLPIDDTHERPPRGKSSSVHRHIAATKKKRINPTNNPLIKGLAPQARQHTTTQPHRSQTLKPTHTLHNPHKANGQHAPEPKLQPTPLLESPPRHLFTCWVEDSTNQHITPGKLLTHLPFRLAMATEPNNTNFKQPRGKISPRPRAPEKIEPIRLGVNQAERPFPESHTRLINKGEPAFDMAHLPPPPESDDDIIREAKPQETTLKTTPASTTENTPPSTEAGKRPYQDAPVSAHTKQVLTPPPPPASDDDILDSAKPKPMTLPEQKKETAQKNERPTITDAKPGERVFDKPPKRES